MKKRYQDCTPIIKIWRMRYYLEVPLLWLWHQIKPLKVYIDEKPGEYETVFGKNLWRLLVGNAQFKMNWYYTMDEVMGRLKNIDSKDEV